MSKRTKKIFELLNNVKNDTTQERSPSPFTEAQKRFFEKHENDADFKACLDELHDRAPTTLSTAKNFTTNNVLLIEPDSNWSPPVRRLSSILSPLLASSPEYPNYTNYTSDLNSPNNRFAFDINRTSVEVFKDACTEFIDNTTSDVGATSNVLNNTGVAEAADSVSNRLRNMQLIRIPTSTPSDVDVPNDPYSSDSGSDWNPPRENQSSTYIPLLTPSSRQQNTTTETDHQPSTSGINQRMDIIIPEKDSSCSSDETFCEEAEESARERRKSRKRVREVNNWKRVVAKKKRLEGEQYVSSVSKTKKVIKKKTLKSPCPSSCKLKCSNIISNESRGQLLNSFWKIINNWDQRRQYIASLIEVVPVMRPRNRTHNDVSRRKSTRIYHFMVNSVRFRVCKKMFLNTFCITEQYVTTTLSKVSAITSVVIPDQRGKHPPANKTPENVTQGIKDHISSFPLYTCHYAREKTTRQFLGPELNIAKMYNLYVENCSKNNVPQEQIAKHWLYSKVFNEQFNLSFYLPSLDTCDTCDKFVALLKFETNPEEITKLTKAKEDHIKDATQRYMLKRQDKENSKQSEGRTATLMLDMQKCLPTPMLTNSQSFYLRKLWTFNETIHNHTENKSYCMMWDETQGGRGGNEVGSCIIEWALHYKCEETKEITLWSDNCAGQNRNIILIYCYFWLVQNTGLEVINHKFLLRGHTHNEVDSIHSVIERKKKELSAFDIAVPRDWKQFVRICKSKNPLIVHEMDINNIFNIKQLSNLCSQRRKNSDNEQFLISKCVWIQIRKKENGIVYYKTAFESDEFSQINLKRNMRQQLFFPVRLPPVSNTIRPISVLKYKDLVTLTQWIADPRLKSFYIELPHATQSDLIEDTEEN